MTLGNARLKNVPMSGIVFAASFHTGCLVVMSLRCCIVSLPWTRRPAGVFISLMRFPGCEGFDGLQWIGSLQDKFARWLFCVQGFDVDARERSAQLCGRAQLRCFGNFHAEQAADLFNVGRLLVTPALTSCTTLQAEARHSLAATDQ